MGENGSTRPQNSVIHQPLVVIFKITLITGIMILPGVYFFMKAFREPVAGVPIGLIGLGGYLLGTRSARKLSMEGGNNIMSRLKRVLFLMGFVKAFNFVEINQITQHFNEDLLRLTKKSPTDIVNEYIKNYFFYLADEKDSSASALNIAINPLKCENIYEIFAELIQINMK